MKFISAVALCALVLVGNFAITRVIGPLASSLICPLLAFLAGRELACWHNRLPSEDRSSTTPR